MAALDAVVPSMVALRREIHANPEPGFEEFETQKRIKRALAELCGLPESAMKACAGTGLVVDIVAPSDAVAMQGPAAPADEPPPIKACDGCGG